MEKAKRQKNTGGVTFKNLPMLIKDILEEREAQHTVLETRNFCLDNYKKRKKIRKILEVEISKFAHNKLRGDMNSRITTIYSIYFSTVDKLTFLINMFFPVNKKIYFLDTRMPFPLVTFNNIVHERILSLKKTITNELIDIINKENMGGELYKVLNEFLRRFGLRPYFLRKIKPKIIGQHMATIKKIKFSFNKINEYLECATCIFTRRFSESVHKSVLQEIYTYQDIPELVRSLDRYSEEMYNVFKKANLLELLLRTFRRYIQVPVSSDYVQKMIEMQNKIDSLLEVFEDERFREAAAQYRTKIFASSPDVIEMVGSWISNAIIASGNNSLSAAGNANPLNGASGDNSLSTDENQTKRLRTARDINSAFSILSKLIEGADPQEEILAKLQELLAMRLLLKRSGINEELHFLSFLSPGASERMRAMVKDARNIRKEGEIRLLLMKKCKWPDYKNTELKIPATARFKARIEKEMAQSGKCIKWIDSLATVNMRINSVDARLSLIQYVIFMGVLDNEDLDSRLITEFYPHYEALVQKGLIKSTGGRLIFTGQVLFASYVPESFMPPSKEAAEGASNASVSLNTQLEAAIMRVLKRTKKTSFEHLHASLAEYNEVTIKERIKILEEKGFLLQKETEICYVT